MAGFNESSVVVLGLNQTVRAFRKADMDTANQIKDALKHAADIIAEEARHVAEEKGLHESGKLIASITTRVTSREAYVRDTAKGKYSKFPYPGIYEFGGRDVNMKRKGYGVSSTVRNRSKQGQRAIEWGLANNYTTSGEFGEYGPRAFLYPALERKQHEVEEAFGKSIDKILDDFSRRG